MCDNQRIKRRKVIKKIEKIMRELDVEVRVEEIR